MSRVQLGLVAAVALSVAVLMEPTAPAPEPPCPEEPAYILAHNVERGHVHADFRYVQASPTPAPVPSETDAGENLDAAGQLLQEGKWVAGGALLIWGLVLAFTARASGWWGTRYGKIALVGILALGWGAVKAIFSGTPPLLALGMGLLAGVIAAGTQAIGKNLLQGNSQPAFR